ncbi:MAG: chemotaxis protein CheX [Chitinophagaceae bacterium]|nr:chemotaxis protein CheX [Oligoflexus sp.]
MIPKRIQKAFDESILGFLSEACSLRAAFADSQADFENADTSLVSTIGFMCDQFKGSLIIHAQAKDVKSSHPMIAMGADVTDEDVFDWAGEMANQILGRLKNSILNLGVELKMSIPSVVQGSEIRVIAQNSGEKTTRYAATENDSFFSFTLTMACAQGFDIESIDKRELVEVTLAPTGDSFLF